VTTLEFYLPGDLGGRLFPVEDELLVERYARALEHLGVPATRRDAFRIDAAGWSPEVASDLGDPHYLGRGVSRPAFVVLSVDQLHAPLLQPNAGYGARAYLEWACAHRAELADLTLQEPVIGSIEHGMTRFRDLEQMGLVRRLRLEVETPSGRLSAAQELSALRAELLSEGDAWKDEDHLARMYAVAADAGGWSDVPDGLASRHELPVGPAFLAEFGGCHLLPGGPEDGPVAWLLVRPTAKPPAVRGEEVKVLPATVRNVNHFLVARGLVDPCPSTASVDKVLLEELREWLVASAGRGDRSIDRDLEEVESILLYCQGRSRTLDLSACTPELRLQIQPVVTEDPALRWWVQHLRASLDPFLRDRLGKSRGGPLNGLFPFSNLNPVTREEVAA
jgi:hypothetical protein